MTGEVKQQAYCLFSIRLRDRPGSKRVLDRVSWRCRGMEEEFLGSSRLSSPARIKRPVVEVSRGRGCRDQFVHSCV